MPAVQAQDRAHFAPVLKRIGRVGVRVDADAVGLAVLLDGFGFDGVHGYSSSAVVGFWGVAEEQIGVAVSTSQLIPIVAS